ncbi:MAG: nucleotide exchange factor GrpE [Paludibacteraceae bacterium]|nr:nucleotide exchange factor GrpE [Paludibacteraceae bacterium]
MDNQSQPIENEEVKAEETVANQAEETATAESAGSATTEAENAASESGSEEDKVKALEEKCAKLHDDYIRLYADFENYKKQALKARSELIKSAGEGIFANMLPLVDDFERAMKAMENATEVSSVKEGVDLIYNKFNSFLAQNGVTPIETQGAAFNVDFHEAVTMIPAPSEDLKGKVVDCTQKGYMLKDKVLRFAKVIVGQ